MQKETSTSIDSVYMYIHLTIYRILSRSQYWSMQLTAFTYDEAEKNAGNSYTPFAILVAWLIWPERKARTKDCSMIGSLFLYRDEENVILCILEIDKYTRLLPHCIRICPISWMLYVLHGTNSFCRAWPIFIHDNMIWFVDDTCRENV